MYIIGNLKYSKLKQGVGYLKLEYERRDIQGLLSRAEHKFNVRLEGNNTHVSIIRDEPIPFIEYWYKHTYPVGVEVRDENIYTNGRFYWVDVTCQYIQVIREELGLSRKPKVPLHLTLGYKC